MVARLRTSPRPIASRHSLLQVARAWFPDDSSHRHRPDGRLATSNSTPGRLLSGGAKVPSGPPRKIALALALHSAYAWRNAAGRGNRRDLTGVGSRWLHGTNAPSDRRAPSIRWKATPRVGGCTSHRASMGCAEEFGSVFGQERPEEGPGRPQSMSPVAEILHRLGYLRAPTTGIGDSRRLGRRVHRPRHPRPRRCCSERWVAHHIEFPDYTDDGLVPIAERLLAGQHYSLSDDARDALGDYLALRREQPHFANARSIRNALDRARLRQAGRHLSAGIVKVDDLSIIEGSDIRASRVFDSTS